MVFGRVITAMITPFRETGGIHYDEAARLASHLVAHGSDALVVCGTTGESPTLTWDEEYQLFQVVRDAVAGKAKVLAGTGSNSTQEAIEATRKAARLGLDGSLQVVPYYNRPSQAGLYQHFRAIAESSDMPVMLYNIPSRTGVTLQPETVARLAEVPGVVAIKEAGGSMDAVSAIRQLTSRDFAIYSGDDSVTLPMLSLGASGVVSVASHLVGEHLSKMVTAFQNGDVSEALRIHLYLLPLFKDLFLETNPVPIKSALQMLGWEVGSVRQPLVPATDSVLAQLRSTLQRIGLLSSAHPEALELTA